MLFLFMHKKVFLLILFFLLKSYGFKAENKVSDNAYPKNNIATVLDTNELEFLNLDYNKIQYFSKASFEKFYNAWQNADNAKVSILHFGDSHVQADIQDAELRKILQGILGDGGRGLCFPYAAAKTYNTIDYKTKYTGTWNYAKSLKLPPQLPLGLTGMTVKTADKNATLTFDFPHETPKDYTLLKIFYKATPVNYDGVLVLNDRDTLKTRFNIDSTEIDEIKCLSLNLPYGANRFKLFLTNENKKGKELELYGFCIEKPDNKGVVVHNAGVGGARFEAIKNQALIPTQIKEINPSLVILDYGTNDVAYNKIPENFENDVVEAIKIIRESAPESSILLTSSQHFYFRKNDVSITEQLSILMKKIAKENDCLFYDWYAVAGGKRSMTLWNAKELAQNDFIHLTVKGYRLKGSLMASAIQNTIQYFANEEKNDSLIMSTLVDKLPKKLPQSFYYKPKKTYNKSRSSTTKTKSVKTHKIANGESLYSIAKKYNTSVDALKKCNNLKSNKIIAGKYLKIC